MRFPALLGAVAVLAAAGCSTYKTPVAVDATPADMAALVGDWSGEYTGQETGRSGTIAFHLRSANDTAFGNVVMAMRQTTSAGHAPADVPHLPQAIPQHEMLTIRFVRVDGGRLVGRLDPYRDPACGCLINTVFTGEFSGADVIQGTFKSTGGFEHLPAQGKWKVTRIRAREALSGSN